LILSQLKNGSETYLRPIHEPQYASVELEGTDGEAFKMDPSWCIAEQKLHVAWTCVPLSPELLCTGPHGRAWCKAQPVFIFRCTVDFACARSETTDTRVNGPQRHPGDAARRAQLVIHLVARLEDRPMPGVSYGAPSNPPPVCSGH
jgi:hypothetical protein